jgi:hypothetical protein
MHKQFYDVDVISAKSQQCESLNLIMLLQARLMPSTNWYLPVCHATLGIRFYDTRTNTERYVMNLPTVNIYMTIVDRTSDIILVQDASICYVVCPSEKTYYSHSFPTNTCLNRNYCIDKYCTERVICATETAIYYWYYQTDAIINVYSFNTALRFYTVFQTGPTSIFVRNHVNYYVWLKIDLESHTHTETSEGYYNFLPLIGQDILLACSYIFASNVLDANGQLIRTLKQHNGFVTAAQLECGHVVTGAHNRGEIFVWTSDMTDIIKKITVKKGVRYLRAFGRGFAAVVGRNVIVWNTQYEIICEILLDLRKLSL